MIPLAKPFIEEDDINEVLKVLKSDFLSFGPKISEFENEFSKVIGTKYGIAVNSGTSGLHLVVKALGIKEGDEVITTPFSFVSSANCLLFEKAKPVFVDIDEKTMNIDSDLIEEKITDKTKAILVVHVFGQTCDMTKIMEIAKKHDLKVIEDACEAPLASHNERNAGTFGDASVFAFYPNKQMTTGEGGMIVTNNKEVLDLCISLRNQGRGDDNKWLYHKRLGYNYRLDEMSCALGLSQTKKLKRIVKRRNDIANIYIDKLKDITSIILPFIKKGNIHSWFVFPIRVDKKIRNELIEKLNSGGIQSKAYFYPCIHLQPFYQDLFGYKHGDFPIAEKVSKQTIILPFYNKISEEDIDRVVKTLKSIMEEIK